MDPFNPIMLRHQEPQEPTFARGGWILFAAILAAGFIFAVAGIDAKSATVTAQLEAEAQAQKAVLVGIPCATWVCQKYHAAEPCGQSHNTACVKADFSKRKK